MLASQVDAQIYTFSDMPVPNAGGLVGLYAFHVFSEKDAPRKGGKAKVKFDHLSLETTGTTHGADPTKYNDIDVSLIRQPTNWNLVTDRFCSATRNTRKRGTFPVGKPLNVYGVRGVKAGHASDKEESLGSTGAYVLTVSNCGNASFPQATISGTVIVKNAHGFLPANQFYKMPFYGWLLVAYSVLGVLWAALSVRWWQAISRLQLCIAGVLLLGFLEALSWYIALKDWNRTGGPRNVLFGFSIWCSVVKACFSYVLVLVTSMGWDVTQPSVDEKTVWNLQVVSFVYIVLGSFRELVFLSHQSYTVSTMLRLVCLVPLVILDFSMIYWAFSVLSELMSLLNERKQTEKLILFQKFWRALIASTVGGTAWALYQFFSIAKGPAKQYTYWWFTSDTAIGIMFLLVLCCMMYIWSPHEHSKKYAYQHQSGEHEGAAIFGSRPSSIWADADGMEEDDDAEGFWAETKKEADFTGAEIVGARDDHI
eukprot:TRINITY_DN35015_c0_g1_i1.p1 TRINITY_DN35015_c0_g1~~TRINITY_DN35015_c0_g1_i1.p1  ORF type:complete len:511 (+),score=68.94 TRINITY_DN35015_c0_g1_i1:93-1535(+)